ncbi:MAG: hypothetical protein ABJ360_00630 [Roseobacter sp.]
MVERPNPAAESEIEKPKRRERIAADLAVLRSTGFSLVVILGVLAIGTVTARDLTQAPVVLEEITVTEDFEKDGLSGLVISNMLWDEIEHIRNQTGKQNKKTVRIQTASRQLDVVAPGSGLSLQRVTQVLRSLFNLPQTRIAGEIACPVRGCTAEEMALTLRIFSGSGTRIIEASPIGRNTMREYLQQTALRLMEEEIDPLVAAWYYYYTAPEGWEVQARAIATQTMVARDRHSEEAMTLLGYLDMDHGEWQIAIDRASAAILLGDDIRNERSLRQRIKSMVFKNDFDAVRAETYFLQGIANARLDQHEEAIDSYLIAQALAPETSVIKVDHAFSLLKMNENQAASDLLSEAVLQDPSDPYTWTPWGEALENQGNTAEADVKREIGVALAKDDPWFYFDSGLWSLDYALNGLLSHCE